tara:strand:+ start:8883 stop:9365 length:483 start_codon:yes stop_codon:yes gene_type:complete
LSKLYVDEIHPKTSGGAVSIPETPRFSVYHTTNDGVAFSSNDHFVTNSTIGHWIPMVGFTFNDGVYTVPVTGDYYTSFYGIKKGSGAVEWSINQISGSSSGVKLRTTVNDTNGMWSPYGFTGILPFVAGDTFKLIVPTVTAADYEIHGMGYTGFAMYKIG